MLVTPRMHGIHHPQVRDETSSTYSVVFSWDLARGLPATVDTGR